MCEKSHGPLHLVPILLHHILLDHDEQNLKNKNKNKQQRNQGHGQAGRRAKAKKSQGGLIELASLEIL